MGLYKIFLEQRVQARENVQEILAPHKAQEQAEANRQKQTLIKPRTGKETQKFRKLELQLERANLLVSPVEFTAITIVAFVAVFLIFLFVTGNLLLAIAAGVIGYFAPILYLNLKV